MKHLFTVFTPTHNRAHLIQNLYESLKRQTCKDFVWLVVDDGSKDNTKEVIDQFIAEGIIDIKYHFIPDGFLYLAERYSSETIDTKYIIRIDDDDFLKENCIEVFLKEWEKIEEAGITDIGEIRALAEREDGTIAGVDSSMIGAKPLDTTYMNIELNSKTRMENIACRKVSVWKQLFRETDASQWLFDKVNHIEDSILWFRLSRICRTRYIYMPLRVYCDNPVSLTHSNLDNLKQRLYNTAFNSYMILNELHDCYLKNKLYFLRWLYVFTKSGFSLGLRYSEMLRALESKVCKVLFLLFSPLLWLISKKL